MENVIYRSTILPAHQAPDGETPMVIYVTQEANGVAVICCGHLEAFEVLMFYPQQCRDVAIEFAVERAKVLKATHAPKAAHV